MGIFKSLSIYFMALMGRFEMLIGVFESPSICFMALLGGFVPLSSGLDRYRRITYEVRRRSSEMKR